jgi:antitoxin MazE
MYVRPCGTVRTEAGMRKKLTRTGNSVALVLDKQLLDRVGIAPDDTVDISTNGQVIVVSPVRDRRRSARLKKIVSEAHQRYGGVFRRLAE